MPRYLLLGRAQDAGALNILMFGASGATAFEDEIRQAGGTIVSSHVTTGAYDLATLVDFEDDIGALGISLRGGAGGIYFEALRAYAPDEVDEARDRFGDLKQLKSEMAQAAEGA